VDKKLALRMATHFFCMAMQNEKKRADRIAKTVVLMEPDEIIDFFTALSLSMGELGITLDKMSKENTVLIESICESLQWTRGKGGE